MKVGHVAVVLLTGLILLLAPASAQAHAVLVSTDPRPGDRLGTAPGVVILRFSEPLNGKLSFATVTDPSGRPFTAQGSGLSISVPLATNLPGTYTVEWKSVSGDDGHTERGSYDFTVIARSSSGEGTTVPSESRVPLGALRTIQYLALLFAVGVLLIDRLARPQPWVRVRRWLPWVLGLALTASVAVVLFEASAASNGLAWHALAEYLTSGVSGTGRLVLLSGEALALAGSVASVTVWPFVLSALVGLSASGHGASVHPVGLGVAVDAGHLVGAGLWAGGIMVLATLRPPGGFREEEGRRLLARFSPVALAAFVTTVGLGIVQAFQDVGTLHALFTTTYGRVLTVKIIGVLAMLPLSVLAWRRRIAPRGEALVAVFVIAAAALLAAYPLPARESASVPSSQRGEPVASALPAPGDLTLGDHAGQILVGLTVRPARPGSNRLLVYLQPIDGSPARIPVTVSIEGKDAMVRGCGPKCRVADATLQGGEQVKVTAGVSTGGVTTFDLPQLPPPEGTTLLDDSQRRMHALDTVRYDEVLNSGLASVRSEYAAQAPDRLHIKVEGKQETIIIGNTRYLQKTPGARWQVQSGGPEVPQPSFIWDYFEPFKDPRIVGQATVAGVPTTIVAFAGGGPSGLAIWFRVWIDHEGLVRQAHMRAIGHFMDHRYFDFDAPLTIAPPVQ